MLNCNYLQHLRTSTSSEMYDCDLYVTGLLYSHDLLEIGSRLLVSQSLKLGPKCLYLNATAMYRIMLLTLYYLYAFHLMAVAKILLCLLKDLANVINQMLKNILLKIIMPCTFTYIYLTGNLFYNDHNILKFGPTCTLSLFKHVLCLGLIKLLLQCSGIHPNPGPQRFHEFCFLHANARSILSLDENRCPAKFENLRQIAHTSSIDIIGITETWLNKKKTT